ncbi:hypothetical protein M8756_03645 [Lutimaribacter sp. EGI FJ00015]|nr:hypothetical protein [Lutimaribacter sp. EGI FJ00015]
MDLHGPGMGKHRRDHDVRLRRAWCLGERLRLPPRAVGGAVTAETRTDGQAKRTGASGGGI